MASSVPPELLEKCFLREVELHLKGINLECILPAKFFHNYQKERPLWAEVVPTSPLLFGAEVAASSPGILKPFPALLGGLRGEMIDGSLSFTSQVVPLGIPIESVPVAALTEVTFALLDSPITGDLISDQRPKNITYSCGEFDVNVTGPTKTHQAVRNALGSFPHTLSGSVATLIDAI